MQLSDFQFELPSELIAKYPAEQRSGSRLLHYHPGEITHRHFYDLPDLLQPNDLLIANDTKVMPARLFGHKVSGGKVEIFIERILTEDTALAMIRSSKKMKVGVEMIINESVSAEVLSLRDNLCELKFHSPEPLDVILQQLGEMPLPPYLQRAAEASDAERYQTVYAEPEGAVAAPTAGLHFDQIVLDRLAEKHIEMAYLTLHVGLGTFQPVRVDNIDDHKMHSEWIDVSADLCAQVAATKAKGGRVIAVGTTTVRALETAARSGTLQAYQGDTDIFISPGFAFNAIDAMITNFHLPGSSLLMLVAAFIGYQPLMDLYQTAISEQYRFYSYGDAMLLEGAK